MDAAVWMTRSVVEARRSSREADAVAHRQAREARRARKGDGRRVPPWRTRRVDIPADATAEVVGPLETVDDRRELAGAGRR
jgi:hypothetical protein